MSVGEIILTVILSLAGVFLVDTLLLFLLGKVITKISDREYQKEREHNSVGE